MSAPAWLSYVGAVAGIIGAFTGIAGAVMGYISYRRSAQFKALDLRLELRKADADTRLPLVDLPNLIEKAKKSRTAVAAANGRYGSGATEQWLRDLDADLLSVEGLHAQLPAVSDDYVSLTHIELEAKLVELHRLQSKVEQLSGKYQAALAADDKDREQIRVDMRARQ